MKVTFTQKKHLLAFVAACFFFAMQPMMAQEFWSEDFSGGIPSGWVNEDLTSMAGEEVIFVHTTDPTAVAAGALGNEPTSTFLSSTADNGYVWANSDRGLTAAPSAYHTTQLTTTAIDCSDKDNVFLRMEALIGVFELDAETNAVARVSTDGENWTSYTLFAGLTTDVRWSANPAMIIADISETAANQSVVYIQFYWQGGWEYFLAIDDISLSSENPAPPTDLQVNSPLGPFYAIAPNAITPASQVEPFGFMADIANIGSEDQQNVNLNVSVYTESNTATPVYSEDLAYGTVAAGEIVENQLFDGLYTPDASAESYIGQYTISSDATDMDAFPNNNTQDFAFIVSEDLFAKDMGATRPIRPADSNWADGEPHSWTYGNYYHVPNGDGWFADYVQFGFDTPEEFIGQTLTAWLYKWEDTNGDAQSQDDERTRVAFNVYEVTGDEGNDIITLQLFNFLDNSTTIPLEDNTDYLVMLEYTAPDAMTDMLLLASEAFDYSAMSFRADSLQAPRYAAFLGIGSETEYSSTGFGLDIAPIARLGIRDTGVKTVELTDSNLIEVFPNPATDMMTARIELEEVATDLNIRIMDVNGRTILSEMHQNVQQGQFTYNLTKWASGTYFIHFATKEGTKTKRFMVQK